MSARIELAQIATKCHKVITAVDVPEDLVTDCEQHPVAQADDGERQDRAVDHADNRDRDPYQRGNENEEGIDKRTFFNDMEVVQDNSRHSEKREYEDDR
ncbi:MAG: hypothetical protein GEV04_22385 [Actinophytocola sp.]|nr:hypothetical protein [Actinophytocola sp.]